MRNDIFLSNSNNIKKNNIIRNRMELDGKIIYLLNFFKLKKILLNKKI